MSRLAASACKWREEGGGQAAAERCLALLDEVGIPVRARAEDEMGQPIEGLAIRNGTVVIDPSVPIWPGDLLHEAGHVAVVEPERRASLNQVRRVLAEERMAIAWSYAAARRCGMSVRQLFHNEGYKGRSNFAAQCYATGQFVGAELLAAQGMTVLDLATALAQGAPTYPGMLRWLR